MPSREIEPRAYHEIQKWCTRDLEPGFEAVAKQGAYVFARRRLVYRAYWVA